MANNQKGMISAFFKNLKETAYLAGLAAALVATHYIMPAMPLIAPIVLVVSWILLALIMQIRSAIKGDKKR